jgi:hypothetical protein
MKVFALSRRRVIQMHLEIWQGLSACNSSATGEGIFVKPNTEEECIMLYYVYPIFAILLF